MSIKLIALTGLIKMLQAKEVGMTQQPDGSYQVQYPYFEKFKSTGTTGWGSKTLLIKKSPA